MRIDHRVDDPLREIGIPVQIGLEFNVHHLHVFADVQHFLDGGDLLALVLGALPLAKVQLAQLVKGHIVDITLDAGVRIGEEIVGNDQLVVLGELDIALDAVGTQLLGQPERRQCVFRCQVGGTAVCYDEGTHTTAPYITMI